MTASNSRAEDIAGARRVAMRAAAGIILIVLGVIANNVVYLQDLWFGQACITLDSALAYGGIAVTVAMVIVGTLLLLFARFR